MRRIEQQSAIGRSAILEIALVAGLLCAALLLYGTGDQLVGAIGDLIANVRAS